MITVTTHDLFSFGTLLKRFRTRGHFTQQRLAEAIGVHRHAIGRWERGDFLPATKTMVLELARHLKLNDQETRQLLEASLTALPLSWSVPLPRNPYFTGREEVLEILHTQLGVDQAVALTQSSALHGLGGVGKTQIALEYAYRHTLEYSAVLWVGAETDEQVVTSLLHIAEALQLPERAEKDQQRVVAAVQHWLTTHGQWLLICDNIEDLDLLDRFLPHIRSGAILLTTRHQALGTLARGLDLAPMEREEGILFLLRRAKALSSEATSEQVHRLAALAPAGYAAASELVTVLGGLPLALDQAGAYLEATQCGLSAYLKLFRTRRAALLTLRGEGVREHPAPVSTTLMLSIRATAKRHPAVHDLLYVCALLQADAIPEELFRQGAEHLGALTAAVCREPLEWDHVVSLACSYSLLARQFETQTLSIHRLVQAVVLDTMTDEEREQWQERVIAALETAFPEMALVGEATVWKRCQRLLPHALLSLERVGAPCHTLPLANLVNKIGCFLRLQGRDAEAEPLFARALSIFEQVLGPSHPDVASTLNNLALGSFNQGRYEEVEPLFARALSIQEQAYGPHHPEVATVLNNQAYILREQGKYTEAQPLFERSLAIREQALGPLDLLVARSLKNLADLCLMQGSYLQAEQYAQRALSIQEQVLGPLHPQVVRTLDTLANLLREQGQYREAEQLYQRGLRIWEQHLGPEHPERALLLDDLAECYHFQQRDAEAEQLYRQSLAIREQGNGQSELYASIPLLGLANLARDRGHYQEAEQLYQRALRLREQYLGEDNPDTAQVIHERALLQYKQGQFSEASSLAERALSIRSQILGDRHPQTVTTRTLCAQLREAHGDIEKDRCAQEQVVQPGHLLSRAEEGRSTPRATRAAPTPLDDERCDSCEAFLVACCELHPLARCRISELWQAYVQWAASVQQQVPLPRRAFAAQIKARGCQVDRTNRARIWRGIRLVKTPPSPP